ncbi:D-tyrosyl-tRNA(Tyr) deacylase [Candidatus Bathyarchaeota archaeon]|nr:MAG: D-tyrosyl-tRNA(Tyr) deacylase [Candidatus Bathyarchaeota archaeon]
MRWDVKLSHVAIALSTADPAGVTLLKAFRELGFRETGKEGLLKRGDVYLVVLGHLIVPAERYKVPEHPRPYPMDFDALAERLSLRYIIIGSRHWSESGKPCLTVHPTGNFGKAMYGGRPRELQPTLANPMRDVFLQLQRDPPKGYTVSLEATHHSPTSFRVPMFFAELGSSEREWRDEEAAAYLAESILRGIEAQGSAPVAIGFGGGHYCPTFTRLEEEMAFGHICPKYALDLLNEGLIRQMVERTLDGVERAVLDKGMKGYQRKMVTVALKRLGLEDIVVRK